MENNKRGKRPLTKKEKIIFGAVFAAIAALFIVGVVFFIQENVYIPEKPYETPPAVTAPPVTPAPATPVPAATPEQSASGPAPVPTPTPQPTIYIPPRPVKIYFPTLEISTEILPVGMNIDGEMATIDDAHMAGWYYDAKYPVSPGEEGNAIIAGHRRWKGKVGDFSKIGELTADDDVVIEFDKGYTRTFRAVSNDLFPLNDYPEWVMTRNTGDARVTLITCAGEFNHDIGTSEDRNVVVLKEVTP